MLGHLNKKGLLQWTRLQGKIFWEPAVGEVDVMQRVALKQDGKPIAVLRIVVKAGKKGITTKCVTKKGIERTSQSLVHLEAMGCVINKAEKGTGNRALWVATKIGRQQVKTNKVNPPPRKERVGLHLGCKSLAVLKVVLLAGKEGITTDGIASAMGEKYLRPDVLSHLAQKGYVKNIAEKGPGKKALWVARKKAREEMIEPGQTIKSLKPGKAKEVKEEKPPKEPRQSKKSRFTDESAVSTSTYESFESFGQTHKRREVVADYRLDDHRERPEELPARPVSLPKRPKKFVELAKPSDWDSLVLQVLTDWRWVLTFEQLVVAVSKEATYFGFSLGLSATATFRKKVTESVVCLKAQGMLLVDSRNSNVLLPPAGESTPQSFAKVVEKHEAHEIAEPDDWNDAVMEALENSEGSATYAEIVASIWQRDLTRWCLRKGTTFSEVGLDVKKAIHGLQLDGQIEVDSDFVEDKEVHWRVA